MDRFCLDIFPASQIVHASELAFAYVPGPQAVHVDAAEAEVGRNEPAPQPAQAVAPAEEIVPVGHRAQVSVDVVPFKNLPATHRVQFNIWLPAPGARPKDPALQAQE